MKAFKLITSEEEIIRANTIIEALKFYEKETDIGLHDFSDNDDIEELPKSEWNHYKVRVEGVGIQTIGELMQEGIGPAILSSTAV